MNFISQKYVISAIRILSLLMGVLLIVAMFGLTNDWGFVRNGLSAGFLLLTPLAFYLRYYNEGFSLFAVAVLFNPFIPLVLPRHIWVIADVLALVGVAIFAVWSTNSHQKGNRFEEYVAGLFPEPEFRMLDRTRDISKFSNRKVESDMHPDFTFRNTNTGKKFAVECKWRNSWWNRNGHYGLSWKQWHTDAYTRFEKEHNIPVWIALGIGGTPQKPRETYILPLLLFKGDFIAQDTVRKGRVLGNTESPSFTG